MRACVRAGGRARARARVCGGVVKRNPRGPLTMAAAAAAQHVADIIDYGGGGGGGVRYNTGGPVEILLSYTHVYIYDPRHRPIIYYIIIYLHVIIILVHYYVP